MKKHGGMWYPDHETGMLEWLAKYGVEVGGRRIYQWKKQAAVMDLCKSMGRTTVALDIGAHIGHWTVNLVDVFREVVAFEPHPEHAKCFRVNTQHAQERIRLVESALSDEAGTVGLSFNRGHSGDTWIKGEGDIKALRLDQLKLGSVDLIKVDTEGHEERVLRGGVETLLAWRPVVIVEQKRDMAARFGDKPLGALAFLKSLGYRQVQELGGDFIMEHSKA